MSNEPTNKEISQKIDHLSGTVNDLSGTVKNLSGTVDEILGAVNEFSNAVDKRFDKIESTMVTKDYLDDKLADLRGDLVVMMQKEDTKVLN